MRIVLLLFLLLVGCTPDNSFRGIVQVGQNHPSVDFITKQLAEGYNTNILVIDSGGGSTSAWRSLTTYSDKIGMLILTGDCNSACLLAAITLSSNGVPVYTKGIEHLIWHGQVGVTKDLTVEEQQFDTTMWMVLGLPLWACDIENSLYYGKKKDMTMSEYTKAGFRKYE